MFPYLNLIIKGLLKELGANTVYAICRGVPKGILINIERHWQVIDIDTTNY